MKKIQSLMMGVTGLFQNSRIPSVVFALIYFTLFTIGLIVLSVLYPIEKIFGEEDTR